jgi:hypothetical protein
MINESRLMKTFTLLLLFVVVGFAASAQTRIGISFNMGNRQQFSGHPEAFERALAPSGSLSLSNTRDLGNKRWSMQYGITCGVVPYNLKVIGIDTVTIPDDIFPFPDYSTIFASAHLMLAPKFVVRNHNLWIGAGVGMTAYASLIPVSQYGIHVADPDNSTLTTVFEAQMSAPTNRFSSFWKIAGIYDLTSRISLGLEYVNHARPAAEGNYEFYHTRKVTYGTIEIYQREIRIGGFYRLKSRSQNGTNQ